MRYPILGRARREDNGVTIHHETVRLEGCTMCDDRHEFGNQVTGVQRKVCILKLTAQKREVVRAVIVVDEDRCAVQVTLGVTRSVKW